MRILVVHNEDLDLDTVDLELEAKVSVRDAARAVTAALCELGHEARRISVGTTPDAIFGPIRTGMPDRLFNLIESIDGLARLEAAAAWILDWLAVPYTGSRPEVLSLALDKRHAKAILAQAGIPVPKGVLLTGDERFEDLPSPWIVKPVRQDASHGIDADSAGRDPAKIRAKAKELKARFGEAPIVEELIEGRELNVGILGAGDRAEALPAGEIDFSKYPPGRPHILTYDAKWRASSPDYLGTPAIDARDLDPAMAAEIARISLGAYRALGIEGYGRIDLRLHPTRGPIVIEANPNPDLSPDAGLAKGAARKGMSYVDLIGRIIDAAR